MYKKNTVGQRGRACASLCDNNSRYKRFHYMVISWRLSCVYMYFPTSQNVIMTPSSAKRVRTLGRFLCLRPASVASTLFFTKYFNVTWDTRLSAEKKNTIKKNKTRVLDRRVKQQVV